MIVTRVAGTCPVCGRQQKVTAQHTMVHHGYRRPGIGQILQDCFGAGYPAYQISTAGCEAYRDWCARAIEDRREVLRSFESRPAEVTYWSDFKKQAFIYRRDASDFDERRKYEDQLARIIRETKIRIVDLQNDREYMIQRIEQWAPAPLLEIDEEGYTPEQRREEDKRKAERHAEKATRKDEKARARAELQAKRNERLARKATELLFFFDSFEDLLNDPPTRERNDYGRALIHELQKKKYGIHYPWDLRWGPDDGYGNRIPGPWGESAVRRAEDTLVALGLARREELSHGRQIVTVFQGHVSPIKIRVPAPDGPAEDVLERIAARPKI
jgi:hypothetical protein